jgi:hypothetical protein
VPSAAPLEHEILSGGGRCFVTKQYQMYTATGLYKNDFCGVCSYPVLKHSAAHVQDMRFFIW